MRTAALLLCLFLSACASGGQLPAVGPEQTPGLPAGVADSTAPVNAQAVLVRTGESESDAYDGAADVLQREGYALAQTDSRTGTLVTARHEASADVGRGVPEYFTHRLSVAVGRGDSTTVRLRGTLLGSPPIVIRKNGKITAGMRLAWRRMVTVGHRIAEAMGGTLDYAK